MGPVGEMTDDLAESFAYDDLTDEQWAEWEYVEQDVDAGHRKHDVTDYFHIVRHRTTHRYYQINYSCSYNYGIEDDSIYWSEVQPVENTIVTYVPIKKGKQ